MEPAPLKLRPSEVIYQIYPATFFDSNNDGHGDLKGVEQKLDYIKSLGADAIWISPFFKSPSDTKKSDGGYAVSNYREVGKKFGSNEDFDSLLKAAHAKGLRVYTDFVLCHTSDEHDWFEKSRNHEPGFENRYVWQPWNGKWDSEGKRVPPNNWKSVFLDENKRAISAWTFDEKRKEFYLHHFNDSQPALNLNDKGVQDNIMEEMRFWLDKGVDGLRLDALPFANYNKNFKDNPPCWGNGDDSMWERQYFAYSMCQPETIDFIHRLRQMADSYSGNRKLLGEVIAGPKGGNDSMEVAKDYLHPDKGLHACYTTSFLQFFSYPTPGRLRAMLKETARISPDGGIGNAMSNHDFPLAASRMTEDAPVDMHGKVIRQLLTLGASLPGDWYIYMGEELGKRQARIPEEIPYDKIRDLVDPARARDGSRTSPPWEENAPNVGFSKAPADQLYLPVPDSHRARAVDVQEHDSDSILNFTRKLTQERKNNPAMIEGSLKVLDTPDPIVAFIRETPEQTVLFAFNMSGQEITLPLSECQLYGKKLDNDMLKRMNIPSSTGTIIIKPYDCTRRGLKGKAKEATTDVPVTSDMDYDPSKVLTVFTADMLLADHPINASKCSALIHERSLQPDQKHVIDAQDNAQLLDANPEYLPGGSTTITLWTTKQLLGDKVKINFMGLAANDPPGKVVKHFLPASDKKCLTPLPGGGMVQETAVSHIVRHPSNHNTLLTYPGTEAEGLRRLREEDGELVKRGIQNCDVVYLNGALMQKFKLPLVANILKHRWENKKRLVLALPSHAIFGNDDPGYYRDLIKSTNVVMGSDEEFCRIYDIPQRRPISDADMREVAHHIQDAFRENVFGNEGMPFDNQNQVAFITRGNKPALLITARGEPMEIPVANATPVNVLGAGDAAFSGFLVGYLKGMNYKKCANLAMALAAEKIAQETPEPYLVDPQKSLDKLRRQPGAIAHGWGFEFIPKGAVTAAMMR